MFSIIMIVSFLQILQESVKKLLPGGGPKVAEALPPSAIAALAATVVVKGIIGLGSVRIKTTQVQALAQGMIPCFAALVIEPFPLSFLLHPFSPIAIY